MAQDREQVAEAVLAFVNAQSWDERRRIAMERRDVLPTDAAAEVLAELLTQYRAY